MQLKFVNRSQELQFLERAYARPGSTLTVLWGRRRVGKTSLLRHFCQGKRLFYHVGTLATEKLALEQWSRGAASFFQDPVLGSQSLSSWPSVLAYLEQRARWETEPWGVVLDEFPYLVESSPALPSLLQASWDGGLKETGLNLILCGSSVAMMESLFFSQRSPLYGRRTGQWKVEPFTVKDLGCMYPRRSLLELLELYCVVGGMPMYADRFAEGTLLESIRREILSKGEALYEEVPFLLREELREPRVYQSILAALAGGAQKFGELSSKTGLDRGHLTGYLATLADLGLVRREVPVTEPRPEKSKRGRYQIADPFVRFWYRFVYPNLSRLEIGDVEAILATAVAPALHDYISAHVEEPLTGLTRNGSLSKYVPFPVATVGRHWSASEELDLVALSADRDQAFVAEVKWSREPISPSLGSELRRRVQGCQALRGCHVTLALISRSGFTGPPEQGVVHIDLARQEI